MNIEQAKALTYGQVIYYKHGRNADGSLERWRVNGAVKTWKRDPSRVRVPLKHGLYNYGYLDETNMKDFEL